MILPLLAAALLSAPAGPPPGPVAPDAPAQPATSADARARARALLGAIDRPVPLEAFRRLGPEGEAALAEIAASEDYPAFRARALEALAALGAAPAAEVHRRLAGERSAPRSVRRAAVRGLAKVLPPARATEALRPLLEADPDASLRAAAAEALSRAAPRAACGAIRRQALREATGPAPFARALRACERAQARPGLSR